MYENLVIHPDDKQWTKSALEAELANMHSKFPILYLRDLRNIKIQETDWWAGSDLTMTAEQTAYRQALRDLPSTATPELDSDGQLTGVTWPVKPS